MGSVSRNKITDTRSLNLFDEGLHEPKLTADGVIDFPSNFRQTSKDPYSSPVWSENKAKLIAQYIYHFIMVTKHGTYIDGFAGPQTEVYNHDSWSAKRVLEINPQWLRRFILCDLSPDQVARLDQLKKERTFAGDKRKIEVLPGDFNDTVNQILAAGDISEKEATFCLIDQRTFECRWETVVKLARHKTTTKIELFYFVPVGWMSRVLAVSKQEEKNRAWWGRDHDFDLLRRARHVDVAKLFMQRFETELGYKRALAWPIHDRGAEGRVMYYMVHATDHPAAPILMNRSYYKSTLGAEPMEHTQSVLDGFDLGTSEITSASAR